MNYRVDMLKDEKDALRNTAHVASSLCQKLADLNVPISRYPLPTAIDSLIPFLSLSVPVDALAPIKTLEIPENIRQALLHRLNCFINELEQQYTSTYRHACLETFRGTNSVVDINSIHQTYQALSERHFLPSIREQVAFILAEVAKRQPPRPESKRVFNTDFTPILEKYFEYNGYPSVVHRSVLAQKSAMIPRQIEVWFQNHRNRAKKEGKFIPRLDSDIPLKRAFDVWQDGRLCNPNRLPTPSDDEKPINVKDEKIHMSRTVSLTNKNESPQKVPGILDDSYLSRPPHAFPATRHFHLPDPFPNNNGVFALPPPTWRRKPASVPPVRSEVDMDEFAQTFHLKLSFSESSRRRGSTPLKYEFPPSRPWFTATTTFPSPAPHPALIGKLHVSRPAPPSLDTFIFKPTFGSTSFPEITFTPSLLVPPGETPARKMRSLPRRIPPKSSSNSFGSRTSSFSSDTSSGSRASSSSSSYSSSPELSTPPSLPNVDLPVFHDDAQHQDLFDFSQTDLDTNHLFANFSPSSQNFDLQYTNPSSNKVPDLSYFGLHFPDFTHNLGQILS